jgi:hypothetical protein
MVEVNQAYAQYMFSENQFKTTVKYGRQVIALANERIIGPVGWRQDQQTFDGVSMLTTPYSERDRQLDVGYAYLTRVNRIFPDNSNTAPFQGRLDMSSHLVHADFSQRDLGSAGIYGLFLDYDSLSVAAQSSSTIGVRVAGPYKVSDALSLIYAGEIATQSDYGNNPNNYRANFLQVDAGVEWREWSSFYRYSLMEGSSATDRFITPLATVHAFDGWADLFVVTPVNGLKTHELAVEWSPLAIEGLTLTAMGLSYFAESTSEHYGDEINLRAEYRVLAFSPNLLVGLKYARFIGDDVATIGGATAEHVNKFWAYTQFKF